MVSQNCLKCGKADTAKEGCIPDLECEHCNGPVTATKGKNGNYWYKCEHCFRKWEVAAILPDWSELFGYSGLAMPGDP